MAPSSHLVAAGGIPQSKTAAHADEWMDIFAVLYILYVKLQTWLCSKPNQWTRLNESLKLADTKEN